MMTEANLLFSPPSLRVHVVEPGIAVRSGWLRCHIGRNVEFSTERLESYCIAKWEPVVYDALLVAAAVEFANRTQRRPSLSWQRDFQLLIPVHEPARWNDKAVLDALHDVLNFLTGDRSRVESCKRKKTLAAPTQQQFSLPSGLTAVIPFSDGMDSRCVAGILDRKMGDKLIRVRLGSKARDGKALSRQRQPFTSIPYRVQAGRHSFAEPTAH